MGRHSQSAQRASVPSAVLSLLGWGAFCCVLAGAGVVWLGGSWTTALLVVGLGVLALGTLALAAVSASSRPRRPPHP